MDFMPKMEEASRPTRSEQMHAGCAKFLSSPLDAAISAKALILHEK
jgi:hypothetical protein